MNFFVGRVIACGSDVVLGVVAWVVGFVVARVVGFVVARVVGLVVAWVVALVVAWVVALVVAWVVGFGVVFRVVTILPQVLHAFAQCLVMYPWRRSQKPYAAQASQL